MKKFICIFMLMLSYFFIYSYDFSLSSIETDMNDVTVYRGKSMQTVSNKNFLISMLATKTSYGIQFSTSITNYSGNDYLFKENCISVYQGNFEESYWEKIEYIPALTYYNNAIAKAKTELVIAGIASAFNTVNAGRTNVSGWGYSNQTRYYYNAKIYSYADASLAAMNSYIALDNLKQNNQDFLSYLENNLLFDSIISANDNYNGIFIVDEKRGPDYKVIIELSPNEIFEFYFTRSDKNEILNPWIDKNRDRHSVVLGFNPSINRFGLYYLWSKPKGIGFYGGIAFRNEGSKIVPYSEVYDINDIKGYDLNYIDPENVGYYNYDWKLDYDTVLYDSYGMYAGVTIKTLPYTWLLLGIGFESINQYYYKGDLFYKIDRSGYDYTFYQNCWLSESAYEDIFVPQIGLNFITNFLSFGVILNAPIKKDVSFDFTLGVSF